MLQDHVDALRRPTPCREAGRCVWRFRTTGSGPSTLIRRAYSGVSWELARCCLLRTLFSYNGKPAEEGGADVRPDLAEGMPEVSSDGLTWTFRLRRGLRYAPPFEDTPIIALDIVRALEREARIGMDLRRRLRLLLLGDPWVRRLPRRWPIPSWASRRPTTGRSSFDSNEVTGDLAIASRSRPQHPSPKEPPKVTTPTTARFLVASGPYMVEGSEDLDFTASARAAGAGVRLRSAHAQRSRGGQGAGLARPGAEPVLGPGDGPAAAAYPDRIELADGGLSSEELARLVDAGEVDLAYAAGARRTIRSRGTGPIRRWRIGCSCMRATSGGPRR